MVLSARLGAEPQALLDRFLRDFGVVPVVFGEQHWREALDALRRFGKGRHPAALLGRRYSNFSEGIWMIESTVGREASLDEHLKSLLGRIAGREGHFREWIAQGYRADILIGVFGKNDQLGFSLPPETLREIGRFELALDFDIYA